MGSLTREDFRNKVFARDGHACVFCNKDVVDAHHVLERRLFSDGGYYLGNGASVCAEHHILCETTEISVEQVREACNITKPVLPEHFYSDVVYDKWGNIILPNGNRIPGELFHDESVQKILERGNVLVRFTHHVKYPRTYHLPWSQNMNDDDRMLTSLEGFEEKRVIVSEKYDGENTTMYQDHIHARSIDSNNHPSRNWVKNFWNQIRFDIPKGWRICGENMYAKHSIHYKSLPSYFVGFSVWNDKNICLSWEESLEWFSLINIFPAYVLYDGIFDIDKIKGLWDNRSWEHIEGYVVRIADEIHYKDFRKKIGKFVRKNHIQTINHHWQSKPIEKNLLEVK